MDHNVDFFHFVIGTWVVGRSKLSIWGPKGTQDLCEGLYSAFGEDLKARKTVGDRSQSGLANIDAQTISGNESINLEHWEVDTLSANHVEGLETLAYRVREKATGNIFVYSSDTKEVSEMDDFARGADILLHDSTLSPYSGETSNDQIVWNQFTEISDDFCEHLSKIHSTPEQAAAVASAAGVGTLVLTHILPYRDEKAMSELASNKFDGRIHIGMDGLRISTE
jgi:ribonuclease BN (tRNA processing enzyme)